MDTLNMIKPIQSSRQLERVIQGIATSDGAGVKLQRVLTQDLQRRLDPFLMLDYFHSDNPDDYLAGFPDHPHRGFETITYMLSGKMRHRDNAGHEGLLDAGGVQWMIAGRGIVHSELPEQENGLMQGFQLWLNLPARDKMIPPSYRDIPATAIPVHQDPQGNQIKIIAGEFAGLAGAIRREVSKPIYLDIQLPANSQLACPLPSDHNAFVYVYQGEINIGNSGQSLQERQMGILETDLDCDGVLLSSTKPSGVLLIAGQPLNEPIAQWGPFVMNTEQELQQAVSDFRRGLF
ncbi:hypothetical protein HNQ59_003701 [Chitinivorax tropicus]|uniref:Pirin family protein n=1 Tax=Chitinivorax tropicus TaxID=714531 RepID=A0A840MUB4_9PROT|nr:pirin family protein [Chitinivorax tropicus]MBB5020382.1 hypothetical protein [Chitinivorax tropicus]